ncbi:MAG: hypothetical protein KJ737_15590 [Proteobacteria bacterium]|nr:hypothetical protein [Pseudomonadota bacterium]
MQKFWKKCVGLSLMLWAGLPGMLFAAGEKATAVVIVADTRNLKGLMGWWGNLYNESHLLFTLLTVVLIPLIGVIFGLLADVIMQRIGIDLKSRELAEH